MARPLRIQYPGAVYHIMSRGNNRDPIVFNDHDRQALQDCLEESLEIYGVLLHAYVLMENHLHFLIETPQANLSEFMRRFILTYTGRINRIHGRTGHLFQGRYKSHLVEKERYLAALSRYIHLNPVRTESMKNRPARDQYSTLKTYRWSSLSGYVRERDRKPFVTYSLILANHGGETPSGRRAYGQWIKKAVMEGTAEEKPGDLIAGYILGEEEFARSVFRKVEGSRRGEQPMERALSTRLTQEALWARMERETRLSRKEIMVKDSPTRDIALEALCRIAGLKGTEVAKLFKLHYSTVSRYRKRARERIEKDASARKLMKELTGTAI